MKASIKALFLPAIAVTAFGCSSLLPRYNQHTLEQTPPLFSSASTNVLITQEWWQSFNSDELNSLISAAFSNNLSLAQAAARFRQAGATAEKLRAASYPTLSATAQAEQSRRSSTGTGSTTSVTTDNYSIGLAASYELDLWGRVNSLRKTASFTSEASFLDLETAAMTLSARTAEIWIQIIEARNRVRLIRTQIDTNSRMLDLLKERATKSNTTLLDVYQQEQQLRTIESRLPAAKQSQELLMNQLSLLLGGHPGSTPAVKAEQLPNLPPPPDTGIPADLLNNRPDIKSAQAKLKAAAWSTSAAQADRLPAIRLTARQTYSSPETAGLFDNWISNLAAGLTAPILDGGIKRSEAKRAKAALDENIASYREAILNAVKDVEDALIREKRSAEGRDALTRQLDSSKKALNEALSRYRNGSTGYLSVLTVLRALQQTEIDLTSSEAALLQARIALHRALGGTWTTSAAIDANGRNLIKEMKNSDKD